MYYIPWNLRWEPKGIHHALLELGFKARVEDQNIIIDFDSGQPTWAHPFARILSLSTRRPQMGIVYNATRIVNRVGCYHQGPVPLDQIEEPLADAMREAGYLLVGEDITEREVVSQCCTPSRRLLRNVQALEELDDARACGDFPSDDEFVTARSSLMDKIEQGILEADDFADPDFVPPPFDTA